MTYCSATDSATREDARQSKRDNEGNNIFTDAVESGDYDRAFNKELASNLRLGDLESFIAENGLFDIPPVAGNFYTQFRYSIYEAIADGDEARVGQIMMEVFKPFIDEKRQETEEEFEENPWKIQAVLNGI